MTTEVQVLTETLHSRFFYFFHRADLSDTSTFEQFAARRMRYYERRFALRHLVILERSVKTINCAFVLKRGIA